MTKKEANAVDRGLLVPVECLGCGDAWNASALATPTQCANCGGTLKQVHAEAAVAAGSVR